MNENETTTTEQPKPAPAAPAAVARDYDAERKARNAELVNLAKLSGREDLLAGALARDILPADFAKELFEAKLKGAKETASAGLQLSEREQKQYSLCRAILAAGQYRTGNVKAWEGAGFEYEISEHIRKGVPASRQAGGFFIPLSIRATITGQTAGTASLGGAGVQTTILDLIELLRNQMVAQQLGARMLTGLTDNITFPRQLTPNQLTWTGENPATANANTNATFEAVALTPKTAMVSTAQSRQLLIQQSFDAEAWVRSDIAAVVARGLDLAALNGSGASNQPTGLLNISGVTTVTTTFGANGAVPDWAAVVQFETELGISNAPGTWNWATTPGIRGKLKQTLQNTVAGAQYIWAPDKTMNGYSAFVSNQIPSNLTHGTSTTICHAMILGAWEELIIAQWGDGLEILVDPYTVASQNMVQYHTFLMADINVRHKQSFAIAKSAKTS